MAPNYSEEKRLAAPPPKHLRGYIAPFSKAERLAVTGAILLAHAYFFAGRSVPVLYDAAAYYAGAVDIHTHGLFTKYTYSQLRPYGYPGFLAIIIGISEAIGVEFRVAAFEIQLALYLLACGVLRWVLIPAMNELKMARLAFGAAVLHPFALIYPTYTLSEGLSIPVTILTLAAIIWIASSARVERFGLAVAAGGFLCGFLQIVRPANLYVYIVFAIGIVLGLRRAAIRRVDCAYYCSIACVCICLPWIPELYNNITYFHRTTIIPPGILDLKVRAPTWGVKYVKYATSTIQGETPQVFYDNPFYGNEPINNALPFRWYLEHPVKGAGTALLHVFGVLDQDLPFPYNTNLAPFYYPAVSIGNMFVVCLGLLGIADALRDQKRFDRGARYAIAILILVVALHLALQAAFDAESRYGVTSLIVLYIWATWCAIYFLPKVGFKGQLAGVAILIVMTVAAGRVSIWMQSHSAAIVNAQNRTRNFRR